MTSYFGEHRVLVAIPTTGERDLSRLMAAAPSLTQTGLTVVIFPNSKNGGAVEFELTSPSTAVSVHPLTVSGYASARNAIIDYAELRGFSHVAFFDDDQIPLANWAASMAEGLLSTTPPPVVVFGPVMGISHGASWATAEDVRSPSVLARPTGAFAGDVYSGNTVVSVDFLKTHHLRFDTKFDRVGGEDTDFFRRATGVGATVFFHRDMIAVEFIPSSRRSVRGRFAAGRSASQRKDTIGRRKRRKIAAKLKAALLSTTYATTAVVAGDRRRAAKAAFCLGVLCGKGTKRE